MAGDDWLVEARYVCDNWLMAARHLWDRYFSDPQNPSRARRATSLKLLLILLFIETNTNINDSISIILNRKVLMIVLYFVGIGLAWIVRR